MCRNTLLFGVLFFGFLNCSFLFCVHAQARARICAGVVVRSVTVSEDIHGEAAFAAGPEKIEVVSSGPEGRVTVIALGPVLGSMDSTDVKIDLACTQNGILLTSMITRSANFHGGGLQNVNWRPKITIVLALKQPEIAVEAVWKMRLSTGAEQTHAWSPPYPDRKYPIILTETVRSMSAPTVSGESSPLQLQLKLARTEVKNNEEIIAQTEIRNTGKDEQSLYVLLCGHTQWSTDNTYVQVAAEGCLKNSIHKMKLKPGESGHWEVPLVLSTRSSLPKSVTFRLGFQSWTDRKTPEVPQIWSNPVTVGVTK